MTPITHSVANCVKRVVVILYALLVTGATVEPLHALGIAISVAGIIAYTAVTGK